MAVIAAIAAALGIALPGGNDSSSSAPGSTAAQRTIASSTAASTSISTGGGSTASAASTTTGGTAAAYPVEERGAIAATLQAIDAGTADRYPEDGQTFQNREGHLPSQPLGYYREYTVETPGSPDRGARRLVIGDHGETYYTNDHYNSFRRIDPEDFG